jgi:hypothetical protein
MLLHCTAHLDLLFYTLTVHIGLSSLSCLDLIQSTWIEVIDRVGLIALIEMPRLIG